jgi:hypothetical protein
MSLSKSLLTKIDASAANISATRGTVGRLLDFMRFTFALALLLIISLFGTLHATNQGGSMSQLSVASQSAVVPNTFTVPVNFDPQGSNVAGLEFDFPIPAGTTFSGVTIGDASTAAGKSITSNLVNGSIRVIIFGLNQTTIAAGVVANINLVAVNAESEPLSLANPSASDPTGTAVPLTTANATLTITGGTVGTTQSAFDAVFAQLGTVVTNEDSVLATALTAIAAAITKLAAALPPGAPADLTTEATTAQAMIADIQTQTASLSTAVTNLQSGTSSAAS